MLPIWAPCSEARIMLYSLTGKWWYQILTWLGQARANFKYQSSIVLFHRLYIRFCAMCYLEARIGYKQQTQLQWSPLLFVSPALAGKAHSYHFVPCCCCCLLLLWNQVNIWLYLPHALMDFNQRLIIDETWEPSFVDEVKGHIKVKGHLRSSCKIGWKCESGLILKIEVRFELGLLI